MRTREKGRYRRRKQEERGRDRQRERMGKGERERGENVKVNCETVRIFSTIAMQQCEREKGKEVRRGELKSEKVRANREELCD